MPNSASCDQAALGALESINEQRKRSYSRMGQPDFDDPNDSNLNGILIQDQNFMQISQNIDNLPERMVNNLMNSEELLNND